jgi:hypothetical protein
MVNVVVTVTDEHRDRIEHVANALRLAGLQVTQVLEELGQVTGTAREDGLDALRAVVGVRSVDQSGDVRIAPPDSPVQ